MRFKYCVVLVCGPMLSTYSCFRTSLTASCSATTAIKYRHVLDRLHDNLALSSEGHRYLRYENLKLVRCSFVFRQFHNNTATDVHSLHVTPLSTPRGTTTHVQPVLIRAYSCGQGQAWSRGSLPYTYLLPRMCRLTRLAIANLAVGHGQPLGYKPVNLLIPRIIRVVPRLSFHQVDHSHSR